MLNVDKVFTTRWTTVDKVRDKIAALIAEKSTITAQEILDEFSNATIQQEVATTAPFVDFQTNAGIVIPDTPTCLELATDIYKDALGDDIDTTTETHVGRMIEQTGKIFVSALGLTAANIMQYDISSATGAYLDALASLFLITRKTAARTKCLVTLVADEFTGTKTANPSDTSFKDVNGVTFTLSASQDFTSQSTALCNFICEESGAVVPLLSPATDVTWNVPDWISTHNIGTNAEIGYEIESDDDLRARLNKAKAASKGFMESVYTALNAIDGVYDAKVIENCTDEETEGSETSMPLDAHSICTIVDFDGTDETKNTIAEALFKSKAVGCAYSQSNVTTIPAPSQIDVNVTDEYFGNTYPVTFFTPGKLRFGVKIYVTSTKYSGSDLEGDIKKAIFSWANGEVPFVDGLKIGQNVKAFEIGAAVSDCIPSLQIDEVKVATITTAGETETWGSDVYSIAVAAYQLGYISSQDDVKVNPGENSSGESS